MESNRSEFPTKMITKVADLVYEVNERHPPQNAIVFSVSEKHGIIPQDQLFNKKIATDDRTKYRRIKYGDIIYNPYLLWNRAIGVCFNRRGGCVSPAYTVLRPRELGIERFLHYFFRSNALTSAVDAISTGSVTRRRTAPLSDILDLTFSIINRTDQKAVNCILEELDQKIELDHRMNETLEEIARAIFKSWFVDFDPVYAKMEGRWKRGQSLPGLPAHLYDLFPDRFVESELHKIPDGWRVGTLDEFCSLNPEKWSKITRPAVINYVDLSNTKHGRIEAIIRYAEQNAPSRAQRVLQPGDTIIGTVRPGNRSYALIYTKGLTGSTGFAVLRPRKTEYTEFVYLAATAPKIIEALAHLADGGAYPAVRPEIIIASRVIRTNEKLINRFSEAINPLFVKLAYNENQSRNLAILRDTMLPKLISGDLRVKDAEKFLKEAGV
jgi:type I restriction enzyme S subunit